ncbi:hypothetical protein BKA65DRAFT_489994 [Rhexocercosporidium sp. MPI-PUGE-AT-0058]|nr:hypothetical protein BKA65DRAFT_489994 [Rhexocercosporidium sp. MPI-PUGE-AT-0058]
MSQSKSSYVSSWDPPRVDNFKEGETPRQRTSCPVCNQSSRTCLQQDHSSGSHSDTSSTSSGIRFVFMTLWLKVKAEVLELSHTKLIFLVARLLPSLVILPVMFASIRNSRAVDGMGRAGKALLSVVQDSSLLVAAGTGFICGWTILALLEAVG